MRFNEDFIREGRLRTNIVEVISEVVSLKKVGRNYRGLCPFHSEKTPSFTESDEKQMFYCFGCGVGGDVIKFLTLYQQIDFKTAVKSLAHRAGISLPKGWMKETKTNINRERTDELLRINKLVAGYYIKSLLSDVGSNARQYLKKRGITRESMKNFYLGYAPGGWRSLVSFLEQTRLPKGLAEKLGIIRKGAKVTDTMIFSGTG